MYENLLEFHRLRSHLYIYILSQLENGEKTCSQIAKALGANYRKIYGYIQTLVDKGIVVRVGEYYHVVDTSISASTLSNANKVEYGDNNDQTIYDDKGRIVVALIGCGEQKQDGPCKAIELYTSVYFAKKREYARRIAGENIFILSAKHGLLDKDKTISRYNETLRGKPNKDKIKWADNVMKQIKKTFTQPSDYVFVFLAGKDYTQYLCKKLTQKGFQYECPLEGLRIGQQMQKMS